jgi:hypothetical protein
MESWQLLIIKNLCVIFKENEVTENFYFKSSDCNFIKHYVHKDFALLPSAYNFNFYLRGQTIKYFNGMTCRLNGGTGKP